MSKNSVVKRMLAAFVSLGIAILVMRICQKLEFTSFEDTDYGTVFSFTVPTIIEGSVLIAISMAAVGIFVALMGLVLMRCYISPWRILLDKLAFRDGEEKEDETPYNNNYVSLDLHESLMMLLIIEGFLTFSFWRTLILNAQLAYQFEFHDFQGYNLVNRFQALSILAVILAVIVVLFLVERAMRLYFKVLSVIMIAAVIGMAGYCMASCAGNLYLIPYFALLVTVTWRLCVWKVKGRHRYKLYF